jgi:hypothetical protein
MAFKALTIMWLIIPNLVESCKLWPTKRCWYIQTPADQKRWYWNLSVNNIVIAKTGNDNNNRKAVIKIDQAKRGNLWMVNFRSHVCNGTNEINGT